MVWFFSLTSIIFASLAAALFYDKKKKIKDISAKDREIQRKVYELNLLREITEKIGYSLNIEAVVETIALTVQDLFDLSTVSYALKGKNEALHVKTFKKENILDLYRTQVSQIISNAMGEIDPNFKSYKILEYPSQFLPEVNREVYFDAVPLSYFNIPLVINNELVGMINISSRKKGVYQEADMTLLYKIVNTAQKTIGRLEDVIETEKGKLDSMISSLPNGAILFGFKRSAFSLSVINRAAKSFLKLQGEPDMAQVIRRFPQGMNLVENIKSIIEQKKSIILNDVKIFEKTFTVFITPVFMHKSEDIVGVSLILKDMTLEKNLQKIREDFTNMIVHELRAPLTAIKGASSLLLSSSLEGNDSEKMLHIISDSARDMLSAISELLDVARMEGGKFMIKEVKSDLGIITQEHLEIFSYAAREKGVEIALDVDPEIPAFFFDPGRIGQVINNLISNSIKFTRSGGKIEIKIRRHAGAEPSLRVESSGTASGRRQNEQVEVLVSDNGIGIPQDKLPLLFTKFGQISDTAVREGSTPIESGSSGLGLYISREIVEAHGGRIWIESEVDVGTKVYFTLPLVLEERQIGKDSLQEFAN